MRLWKIKKHSDKKANIVRKSLERKLKIFVKWNTSIKLLCDNHTIKNLIFTSNFSLLILAFFFVMFTHYFFISISSQIYFHFYSTWSILFLFYILSIILSITYVVCLYLYSNNFAYPSVCLWVSWIKTSPYTVLILLSTYYSILF